MSIEWVRMVRAMNRDGHLSRAGMSDAMERLADELLTTQQALGQEAARNETLRGELDALRIERDNFKAAAEAFEATPAAAITDEQITTRLADAANELREKTGRECRVSCVEYSYHSPHPVFAVDIIGCVFRRGSTIAIAVEDALREWEALEASK